jgi:hypothetical protein
MHAIVVVQPDRQLFEDGAGVRFGADADVITLEGPDERLGHAIALRAFDGCGSRDQADVAGEPAGVMRGVAAAVISQPLDRLGTRFT